MMLEDLGIGYHLVPLSDHVRMTTGGKRRDRITEKDWYMANRLVARHGFTDDAYEMAKEMIAARQEMRRDHRAAEARKREERKRRWYVENCDPMALQAVMILKQVRKDLWENVV